MGRFYLFLFVGSFLEARNWDRLVMAILLVMVVYINDFNRIFFTEYKNCSVFSIYPKTPDTHISRFKQFCSQTWVKRIIFKKPYLFFKFLFKIFLFEIIVNLWMERKDFHFLK